VMLDAGILSAAAFAVPAANGKASAGQDQQTAAEASRNVGSDTCAALALSPVNKLHSNIGNRVNSTNSSRFFNEPRDINGTLAPTACGLTAPRNFHVNNFLLGVHYEF